MLDKQKINEHEKRLAKRIGATRQPASGALDHRKGDMLLGDFLLDDKHTSGKSISITVEQLVKLNREAREAGKEPCLSLSFEQMQSASPTWYLVPEYVFLGRLQNGV